MCRAALLALTEDADFVCYRYRLAAFAPALRAGGWRLEPWPRRRRLHECVAMLRAIRGADAVVVQRRLFSVAKAWLIRRAARVLVFDFDDAIYCRDSNAPRAADDPVRLARFRRMVRFADGCLAGSDHLRRAADACGGQLRAALMPTCVDPTRYPLAAHDRPAGAAELIWIGSPSTAASLTDARPCLAAAAATVPGLRLHALCDARDRDCGVPARHSSWSAASETDDLARADIGIAWLPDHPWSAGKCGLKVLQYMAAGLPVVANSIGIHRHLIDHGTTGFLADTPAEWRHRGLQAGDDAEDFLLVTWDSCRYDVYAAAHTPVLDRHGTARRAWAMATYTLPAHQAMFNGFLPHVFEPLPLYNRYAQQLWRISHRNLAVRPVVTFPEATVSIVEGFRRRGYATLGVAAMDWFAKPSPLQDGFEWFRVTGTAAREQVKLVCEQVERRARRRPCFAFINFGETHSPFRHEEMPPLASDPVAERMSLGRLFNAGGVPDAAGTLDPLLWDRQRQCAEYLDRRMADLLASFSARGRPTTVVVTADHGECLGEQGLFGHAFHHEKVMEVPLLIFRLNAPPHEPPRPFRGSAGLTAPSRPLVVR